MCRRAIRYGIRRRAFTLIELLVVVGVISLLVAILVPSLSRAKHFVRRAMCASNLHHVGVAIHTYAYDFEDMIPFGPAGGPPSETNFYAVTGNVTSLLSLEDGAPVGLGLLLRRYLADEPLMLFCRGADQPSDAEAQLALVGRGQAQGDYYYRHGSVAILAGPPPTPHMRLGELGNGRGGLPVSALVMDVQFVADPMLAAYQVVTRTSHLREASNVLSADGDVRSVANTDERLTVDIGVYPYDALDKVLGVFELLDGSR